MSIIWSSIASRCAIFVGATKFPALAFVSTSAARTRQLSSSLLFRHHHHYNNNNNNDNRQQFQFNHWALRSENNNNNNNANQSNDFEPTWTYVPYDPKKKNAPPSQRPRRRPFSTWTVPKRVEIPEDQLELSFVRSSGAGGQNVNKVNSKVELKLHVKGATFMPFEVRERLSNNQANRINKDGYLTVVSQEHRTQAQNRKTAVAKLEQMILEAWPRPKVRKQRKGISKAAKQRNKEFKKRRSEKKTSRGKVDF